MTNAALTSSSPNNNLAVASPLRRLSFYWSPNRQRFACNETVIENQSSIGTDPSHDLAHLIIAANGELPWSPRGDRDRVCYAEYNAVLVENLFDKTCNAIVFGTSVMGDAMGEALKHMDWFVTQHYAPFPSSSRIAYRHFCRRINPFAIASLFPYYLEVKRYERSHPSYRNAEYKLDFTSRDRPPADELGWLAQWSIYRQLQAARKALGIRDEGSIERQKVQEALDKIDKLRVSNS
ncbi:MAG: hypothetical protein SW833_05125 [Cyanobacteriota bacterium]|nr:hypothetical protein [Cyanobacteriota bacterium]